jgi:hypothetical protein
MSSTKSTKVYNRLAPLGHTRADLGAGSRAIIDDHRLINVTIEVNGTPRHINIESDTRLLWVLRDIIGLTGTKFGCGIAQCGACTVHIDGSPMRSCSVPIGTLATPRDARGTAVTFGSLMVSRAALLCVRRINSGLAPVCCADTASTHHV